MKAPELAADVIAVRAGSETVVYVESTGALHLLDPVATVVLELLDGGRSPSEVSADLARRFGTSADVISADVRRLLADLEAKAVLAATAA